MFPPDFFKKDNPLRTSHGRFVDRIDNWKKKKPKTWFIHHTLWWFIHNVPTHFMLGVMPIKPVFELHDWTSKKLAGE